MRRYFLLLILLLTACGTTATDTPPAAAPTAAPVVAADPCGVAVLQVYRRSYNEIMGRWSTATVQAGRVPPADLQQPIEELQKLINELAAVTPPTCAQPALPISRWSAATPTGSRLATRALMASAVSPRSTSSPTRSAGWTR